ncbi:uncharacterized protein (DUF1778 family) [Arcanobacterium wilhelmae]|uniref:Uncharacterized protein (DUF1778 family) n=1 Tax=Arcanobacterium wilhelmae TaxID=1803177 RepID=A0ABT9NBI2_9ACTO|nr:DUF6290 family protein [Arcanobacterium wilhelmae]MDP9801055.1 uncharacterized protein (DUF1778 family) [Arcanobacterium wilhelmae]WFN90412.1 DUF6290 family protein [Arcanobacterium wilhelmae]
MSSTTFTMRMDDSQKKLIAEFAKARGESMAEFILSTALDRIEDEIDVRDWHEAKAEFDADPVTYSMDEIKAEFGVK